MVVFWWMRWRDVGCSSLHERHISSNLSDDTAALLFRRVLHFLVVVFQNNTTYCRVASIITIMGIQRKAVLYRINLHSRSLLISSQRNY